MNRYNQGFKYFGPLEQTTNGDWIKFEDHKHQLKIEIDTAFGLLAEEQQESEELRNQIKFLTNAIQSTEKQLFEVGIIASIASALVVIESVYFILKLV